MDIAMVKTIRIHPAIGIARVGDSPDFFVGPEIPGNTPDPGNQSYKKEGRVKRQAARFRLFGYDENGAVVGEITSADAQIEWSVHLANKKAAGLEYAGSELRNADITGEARKGLVIDPGSRTLGGPNQRVTFDTGNFIYKGIQVAVPLGEARTDGEGRLLVLGGVGKAASPTGRQIQEAFNNDSWYDDVSDGPVAAKVRLTNGTQPPVEGAWIIVAPPDFAPAIPMPTSLWERIAAALNIPAPTKPSYTLDIHPVLESAMKIRWVQNVGSVHRWGGDNGQDWPPNLKQTIFNKLRPQGSMPRLLNGPDNSELTPRQLEMMKKWVDGQFEKDWGLIPPQITPAGLDRAALSACSGASFNPGIEGGAFLIEPSNYIAPFRLRHNLGAGAVSARMAIPWHSDFEACIKGWWPAQRPVDVIPEGTTEYKSWDRGAGGGDGLVENWKKLGFVTKKGDRYVETERDLSLPNERTETEQLESLAAEAEDLAAEKSALAVE